MNRRCPSLLARLSPVDLVLVEGFKASPHPKIEVHRPALGRPPLWPGRADIVAVAADAALTGCERPVLPLNDPAAVAAWVLAFLRPIRCTAPQRLEPRAVTKAHWHRPRLAHAKTDCATRTSAHAAHSPCSASPCCSPVCQSFVGSPFDGFGGFFGDTQTFASNPNRPLGNTPNMLRADGEEVDVEPLTAESGNVWPGTGSRRPDAAGPASTSRTSPTRPRQPPLPPAAHPQPRGSSTPPGSAMPPPPAPMPLSATPPQLPPQRQPSTQFYQSPAGTAISPQPGNGVRTYTDPRGGIGIIVPNGNGTSTLIAPDGTVTTAPEPALSGRVLPPWHPRPAPCACSSSPGCASASARRRRRWRCRPRSATVGELVAWLRARSPGHAAAFATGAAVRCAVNQDFAGPDAPVAAGDEVAFFPPVTGG